MAQLLLTQGPSTIDQLTEMLDIPRSSVHRALQTLTEAGWVHRNLTKVRYVASAYLQQRMREGHVGTPHHDALAQLIAGMGITDVYHIDFSIWHSTDVPYLIDSTDKTAAIGLPLSPITDALARILICSMPRELKVKHLTRYLKTAAVEEIAKSNQPDFTHLFIFKNNRDYLWDSRFGSICVVAMVQGTMLGLQLRPKHTNPQISANYKARILEAVQDLRRDIQNL